MRYRSSEQGIPAVEVVIGAGILALLALSAALTLGLFVRSATEAKERTVAIFLAEAGVEYARQIRSEDWANITGLTVGTTYYFDVSTTTLVTTATPEVIDNHYVRSFYLTDLYRDGNDDITPSTTPGATVDTDSFYLTVDVTFATSTATTTESLSAIITNLHNE